MLKLSNKMRGCFLWSSRRLRNTTSTSITKYVIIKDCKSFLRKLCNLKPHQLFCAIIFIVLSKAVFAIALPNSDYSSANNYEHRDLHYKKIVTKQKQIVHLINPEKFTIKSVHASSLDKSIAYVSNIARKNNALIGINGGFFKVNEYNKVASPAGVLKVDKKWHGIAYNPRAAIGWNKGQSNALIDILQTYTTVKVGMKSYNVNSFNPLKKFNKGTIFSFENKSRFLLTFFFTSTLT